MHSAMTIRFVGVLVLGALPALGAGDDPARTDASPTARLYPHPVITEVFFNVPKGDHADANGDGLRQANADEFVELFNPHPKTINLRGYTITNRITTYDDDTKRGVRFTFPPLMMEPGTVVVVFNGFDTTIPGPVGTEKRAPARRNEHFAAAYVFTIDPSSRTSTFANGGDFVLLSDPHGNPIDAVEWGDPDPAPPSQTLRTVEVDKNPKGSVQRVTADAPMQPHRRIDHHMFSPGRLPRTPASATPEPGDDPPSERE